MTQSMRDALKGSGEGLQQISSSVGDVLGGSYDMRNKQSKASDEAGTAIRGMGKSPGPTVESKSVNAAGQIQNQSTGSADHLEMGIRKET